MRRRGWIAVGAVVPTVVVISGFAIAHDNRELAVKPPAVTGTVSYQSARNTDPRARQLLDDVHRGEYSWLSMPGTFVEVTVHWHVPRRLASPYCEVAVHMVPAAVGRLGSTSTGAIGDVAMGGDDRLQKAFQEPGQTDPLGTTSYTVQPAGTDGTITFVVDYLDQYKTAYAAADTRASAVVDCDNHDYLFNHERYVTGPVSTLSMSSAS